MSEPVVSTTGGAVRGRSEGTWSVFLGVPFAAPPTGSLRFDAPEPHPRWPGVRDATRPGPTAPQAPRNGFGALDLSPMFVVADEADPDYLTVNVWSPKDANRCPVMVFVHGGGFLSGSTRSPMYDGAAFARDGVVLVTVTYRLGVIGFLDLPDAPPNRGLLDVLAALRWVKDNVAVFGGDPGNVTLFGQSAGATITTAVLATPEAAGLVRRVIVQSGNGSGALDREQAARVTHRAAGMLDVAPSAAGFGAIADDRLVQVGAALVGTDLRTARRLDPLIGLSPFNLVLDRQPADAVADGIGAEVPMLIGTNADEGNLYLVPQGAFADSTERDVVDLASVTSRDPEAAIHDVRARLPGATWGEVRAAMLGDALFGAGSRRLVQAHASQGAAPLHEYEFIWRSTAVGGLLGAAHTVEVPFVFDCLAAPGLRGPRCLLGPGDPPQRLADEMHGAWVGYASTGDPGWQRHKVFGA
jgi:para-nitrobenzyl esterase